MNQVLFCYDGPIYHFSDSYYTIGFTDSILQRYRALASEIVFFVRVKELNSESETIKFSRISNSFTKIVKADNLSSPLDYVGNKKKIEQKLVELVKNSSFVVIRLPSLLGLSCFKIAKKLGKKTIVEIVGNAKETYYYHSLLGKLTCLLFQAKVKHCVKHSDYVSYLTREYLQLVYPTKGLGWICPNVNIEKMNCEDKNAAKFRNSCITKESTIVFSSVGAISEKYKGHIYAAKAIKKLKNKGFVNIQYLIIGGGTNKLLSRYIDKHRLKDNIVLLGQKPHSEITKYLDKTNIYIQPSLSEAQGRSLIEAMSRGCLCLCSNVGGMKELQPSFLRFHPKSGKAIYKKIKLLLDMNVAAKEHIIEDNYRVSDGFTADIVNEQRLCFFNTIKKNEQ